MTLRVRRGLRDCRSGQDVDGLVARPDGNNVSMDREGLQLAKSQLQFKLGVQLLKHEFSGVMSAIHVDGEITVNFFGVMDVSASALQAERVRAEVVASNMANAETTRTPEGGPYQRHHVVFEAQDGGSFQESLVNQMNGAGSNFGSGLKKVLSAGFSAGLSDGVTVPNGAPGGVAVAGVISDASAPLMRYDPQHPDAGPDGFVAYPDINPLTEMVDLMGATRSYGMNASAIRQRRVWSRRRSIF